MLVKAASNQHRSSNSYQPARQEEFLLPGRDLTPGSKQLVAHLRSCLFVCDPGQLSFLVIPAANCTSHYRETLRAAVLYRLTGTRHFIQRRS